MVYNQVKKLGIQYFTLTILLEWKKVLNKRRNSQMKNLSSGPLKKFNSIQSFTSREEIMLFLKGQFLHHPNWIRYPFLFQNAEIFPKSYMLTRRWSSWVHYVHKTAYILPKFKIFENSFYTSLQTCYEYMTDWLDVTFILKTKYKITTIFAYNLLICL